ncbi:hypothetical protein PMIN03_004459 [Paraphaeosphaeria minitans]
MARGSLGPSLKMYNIASIAWKPSSIGTRTQIAMYLRIIVAICNVRGLGGIVVILGFRCLIVNMAATRLFDLSFFFDVCEACRVSGTHVPDLATNSDCTHTINCTALRRDTGAKR